MTIQSFSRTMAASSCVIEEDTGGNHQMFSIYMLCTKKQKEIQKLRNNIDWLVAEEKTKSFDELCDTDKHELVGLLINALDDQSEWIVECKDQDMIAGAFAKYMVTKKAPDMNYFLDVLQANAVKYFAEHLDDEIKATYGQYHREQCYGKHVDDQIEHKLAMGF